ncbi:PAS domain-containing protein [Streptomyces rimosus subsp. rimosus ATCC 10970]|uniref:PAS domain-containing protein n=1 Tax=Streptomyces rimosus subsp. rimosus (strain ATCC 10970 / DSM 40260 / JCM 4667 / NRRL 2234) TaxID=1265868 RepID=A0A8A1UW55_STRR1|nr:PAS domain-containing protein [Streptomyces sp. SID5471]QDA04995.1 PAS domain S-box protein [Streptomyces rimosus]QGY70104.1 PAS domain-containing protein [Streptomyces rimosus R6-500]QST82972.1 PAS domain-containing protein [Streptomyces rimosus subsp. rimosus ATCC 10970]QTL87095.1 PAS domain-containing protein [Streptomyces rimosus subsp. rimosus]
MAASSSSSSSSSSSHRFEPVPPGGPGRAADRGGPPDDACAGAVPGDGPDPQPDSEDSGLLAALLDGMDAALCAFGADGAVTHWNREAERLLGWTAAEAVGRQGLAGWAVRKEDADEVEADLLAATRSPGRQVHEFALLTKDGRRVLVRTQSSAVLGPDGRAAGVYCAFSEVHAQIDLERSIALSEALFVDASWGVVLVDADLRPAVVNAHAARALGMGRTAVLGRPLGDLLAQGVEELESALTHVLAEGTPPAAAELWVTLRSDEVEQTRRCWRSGFVRLASPLAEEPVPLGVGWIFQDVTDAKRAEQEASLLRFRAQQLHRAGRAAGECEDPMEAAAVHLDFALAGFADHGLIDVVGGGGGGDTGVSAVGPDAAGPPALVRAIASPAGAPGPSEAMPPTGIPVAYGPGHPAAQALERCGSVRAGAGPAIAEGWAAARKWPDGTVHGLCVVLRSRGRTLGVATFLRGPSRRPFDRADASYAEDVASRIAAALDLAGGPAGREP